MGRILEALLQIDTCFHGHIKQTMSSHVVTVIYPTYVQLDQQIYLQVIPDGVR